VLATSDFQKLARFQAKAMGLPNLRIVVIPAPLGGISQDEALKKVPVALDVIAAMFNE
jgi:hypothetical protein